MGVGNYLHGSENDGSWGARFNLYATNHSKLELYQQTNGVKLAAWVHSGHLRGYLGTLTNHPLYLHTANDTNKSLIIDTEGRYTASKQPSFAAYKNANSYTASGDLVFDQTRHNVGGHYSTSTGRFTAPVTGSYQINFYSIHRGNANNFYAAVYKNGGQINGGYIHWTHPSLGSQWDYIAYSQVLYLNANDYINMWSAQSVIWHGNGWQCFSGYLLG